MCQIKEVKCNGPNSTLGSICVNPADGEQSAAGAAPTRSPVRGRKLRS